MKRKNNFNLENICLILNARRQKRCRAEKALLGPPPTFIFWASPKGKCCKAFGLNWRGMLIRYILMSHYPKAINSKLVILKNSIFVQICRSTPPSPQKKPNSINCANLSVSSSNPASKLGHSRPLFYFRLFNYSKVFQGLDSNCRPLVWEATALPTDPQPLPNKMFYIIIPVQAKARAMELFSRRRWKLYRPKW